MMERIGLLSALETVAPALSSNDLIQVLTHLWFDGESVMAYNDKIAIRTPLKTEFRGAAPGELLISLLKASRAKNVEFSPKKDRLFIKAASSNLELGLLPPNSFAFEMPEPMGPVAELDVKPAELLEQVALCLESVGTDVAVPDQLGVTFLANGDELLMFSTNGATMTRAELAFKGSVPFKDRVILSTQFCQQMLRLGKDAKSVTLEIHDSYALFVVGDTYLFGRLIESQFPLKYLSVFNNHFPDSSRKKLVPIPSKITGILDRAVIITDTSLDKPYTEVTVQDGVMHFFSKTSHGEISDQLQLADKHPVAKLRVKPKLLKSAEANFDNMLMTDTAAILERKGAVFLVAAQQ